MSNTSTTEKRKSRISCLGVLLIVCMLLLAAFTLTVNLLFRSKDSLPTFLGHRYYCYRSTDMEPIIPEGALVILNEKDSSAPVTNDVVLYSATTGEYRIGQVSLILNAAADADAAQAQPLYYLTTKANTNSIAVSAENIAGICRQRSPELGAMICFLTSILGLVLCLILPCVVLLLYVAAIYIAAREDDDDDDDDDTDLAFVKSIQEKKKAVADTTKKVAESSAAPALTEDEKKEQEEQEAARRAERIAAIRKNIENHRNSAPITSEVPLYTTQTAIPTTKQIPKPDPELMDLIAGRPSKRTGPLPIVKEESESNPQNSSPLEEKLAETQPKAKTKTEQPKKSAASDPAPERKKPAAPKASAAKKSSASQSSSANFDDLMAMLNAAQKELDE